jgi:3-deoxy-D-manno-octulosonic acid kinase
VPIAARYHRTGRYTYSADLLTEQIPDAPSLATHLQRAPLAPSSWSAIGRCVRRFHADGVYHADLNAHNVLLSEGDRVWLVDFDRGGLRTPGFWCDSNLVRLRRSIEKITDALPLGHFCEADWSSLLDAYLTLDQSVLAQEPV